MNTILMNTISLDDGKVIVKGGGNSGGGGGDTPSGGGGASAGAVNFRDYDGTILHSYSKDEFLALAEMPTLPTIQGLTCQGWNYNLDDAKAYVSDYGVLEVSATFITDDGKTRLYISVPNGRQDVPLYISQTVANGVTIDWGDGSATETLSGSGNVNTTHHYDNIGDYVISLDVADGCTLGLGHGSSFYCVMGSTNNYGKVYCNMLQRAEIGKGVTSIGDYAFYSCYSLASIVIPQGITSIGKNVFNYCYALTSVVIPQGVTQIGTFAFQECYSLDFVVIPKSLTSYSGAFTKCYSLSLLVLTEGLEKLAQSAFNSCYSLASLVIPKSVILTSNAVFSGCYSLVSVVIPPNLTYIDTNFFANCYGMAFYDFTSHKSVPSLASVNVFNNIPSDCKIVVPDALYDTWIAATNWSTYANQIIKASEFNA
jgi:hypothetical protein